MRLLEKVDQTAKDFRLTEHNFEELDSYMAQI